LSKVSGVGALQGFCCGWMLETSEREKKKKKETGPRQDVVAFVGRAFMVQ